VAQKKLRGIIFDIGRVLIRIDVSRAMHSLAFDPSISPAELWSAIENDPRWKDWQEGRISPRDWHLHLKQRFGGSATFEQFTEAWNQVLDPEPIHNKLFFEKLSKKYRLALLSNTDSIHVQFMEPRYDFFPYFKARIYSCAVGSSKPNPLIFRDALRACRVTSEEALYVDDIAEYVKAAQQLGMAATQFRSPQQLAADLAKHGVEL
jgi:putative hydrolase of the HAD superfamily